MTIARNRLSLLKRIIRGVASTALFLLARNLNSLASGSVKPLASDLVVAIFGVVVAITELKFVVKMIFVKEI